MNEPDSRSRVVPGHYLGVECGATRSVAVVADAAGRLARRIEAGPANVRLLTDRALVEHFHSIARQLTGEGLAGIGIGMAGARSSVERDRIRRAAAAAWPGVPCHATNDLETALAAATIERSPARVQTAAQVLVLSGTGSCCFGRSARGATAKIGGWGHVLGDKASGYEIGLRALKAVVYYLDRDREWSRLGRQILRALELNEPNDLIAWAQAAAKHEVAGLAIEVFKAATQRDPIARDILAGAVSSLAKDATDCARQLAGPSSAVQFVLAGSVLLKQPRFARRVAAEIRQRWPRAVVGPLPREGAWGALRLGQAAAAATPAPISAAPTSSPRRKPVTHARRTETDLALIAESPTEQRHPKSRNLDRLPLPQAIRLMLEEDATVPRALLKELPGIEQAVRHIVRSFRSGGRLFYVGAGTSGRLGVLDASECPPTFRTDPELVQGIIAGGQQALWSAVEGAEDDAEAGARAVRYRGVTRHDTVVGIAASGRTPFVWGALREARRRGAVDILLCFNPNLPIARGDRPRVVLAPAIGPELLTGSTRLKAGTATKLILNVFTTLAMVQLGKVKSNLMIDVKASNTKLRDRAVRIVRELTGADPDAARAALVRSNWKIQNACARLKRGHSRTRRGVAGQN